MSRRALACANHTLADEVANDALIGGATALGACLTGFFVCAALSPAVLLSPIGIILGGVGVGGRAFDGRWRQPGIGAKRPRGFLDSERIPQAARIAIPGSISAVSVACAYQTGTSLSSVIRPALSYAKKSGDPDRHKVLSKVRELGASALRDPLFARPLQQIGSPAEGGTVSEGDFEPQLNLDVGLSEAVRGGQRQFELPWANQAGPAKGKLGVVLAVDINGSFAAVHFQWLDDGPMLEGLGVVAPLGAVPVRRGVPRVNPGTLLPAPAPILFGCDEEGQVNSVMGDPDWIEPGEQPSLMLRRHPRTREVERVIPGKTASLGA